MTRRQVWLAGSGAAAVLVAFISVSACADDTDPEPEGPFPKTTAKHRNDSITNLRTIGIAFHNFHDTNGAFPDAAIRDAKGKALLSWRVALLPYIEQNQLYQKFKLDEPWDSKHNKELLKEMPKVYAPTVSSKPRKASTTYYRVFTGANTLFDPKAARGQGATTLGKPLAAITDGTSNTVLAVEGGDAVLWTKPDELEYDLNKPIPKLGGLFKEGFNLVMCDGATRTFGRKVDAADMHKLINPSDGQFIDVNKIPGPEKK